MEYNKNRLLEAIELIRQSVSMFNSLDVELEPLSYTEPLNKILMGLDDVLEGIEELETIIDKEA